MPAHHAKRGGKDKRNWIMECMGNATPAHAFSHCIHPRLTLKEDGNGYNRDQQEFVKEGRVGEAAEAARSAVEDDRRDLEKAEKEGKRRAAEHDPEEVRDYRKPE